MNWSIRFIITSVMLGVGLAMDAFSVSLANGLHEPCMRKRKMCAVAGIFAIFQGMMPMFGWLCVHTIVNLFQEFAKLIPWIALILLCFIGGHMLIEGIRGEEEEEALAAARRAEPARASNSGSEAAKGERQSGEESMRR